MPYRQRKRFDDLNSGMSSDVDIDIIDVRYDLY